MPFWRVEHFWGDTAHLCCCGSSLHPPQQQLDKPPPASHTQAPAQGWTLPSSQLCFDPLMDSPKPKGACPLRPSQSPRPTAQVVSWPHKKHNPLLPYHSIRRAGLRVERHRGPQLRACNVTPRCRDALQWMKQWQAAFFVLFYTSSSSRAWRQKTAGWSQ